MNCVKDRFAEFGGIQIYMCVFIYMHIKALQHGEDKKRLELVVLKVVQGLLETNV